VILILLTNKYSATVHSAYYHGSNGFADNRIELECNIIVHFGTFIFMLYMM